MSQYDEKLLKSAATFLSRWNGVAAELFELTSSHRTLTILLRDRGREGNLLLACLEPKYIQGPTRWAPCQIRVSVIDAKRARDRLIEVCDDSVGMVVKCGSLEINENVKLR